MKQAKGAFAICSGRRSFPSNKPWSDPQPSGNGCPQLTFATPHNPEVTFSLQSCSQEKPYLT